MLEVLVYDDLASYEKAIRPFLEQREAEHTLLLGIAQAFQNRPPTGRMFMGRVVSDAETVLVGFFTSHLLAISHGDLSAASALASRIFEAEPNLPGVVGPPEMVETFTADYLGLTGGRIRATVEQRIYACHNVIPPVGANGCLQVATLPDADWILDWSQEFHEEAMPESPFNREMTKTNLESKIQSGWIFFWEVEAVPVSFAGIGRPTANSFTIGPVYTPVRFRGKGYASALTAGVTQAILDQGKTFAALYTDLSNPTSNSMYQKIGYEAVCDSRNHWYGGA